MQIWPWHVQTVALHLSTGDVHDNQAGIYQSPLEIKQSLELLFPVLSVPKEGSGLRDEGRPWQNLQAGSAKRGRQIGDREIGINL
jgi:hypothetical protein